MANRQRQSAHATKQAVKETDRDDYVGLEAVHFWNKSREKIVEHENSFALCMT